MADRGGYKGGGREEGKRVIDKMRSVHSRLTSYKEVRF